MQQFPVKVEQPSANKPTGGNIFSRVFDELTTFCRSRSLFILHYCTGCGAIELPPAMTSRFDMERLGISPMVSPRQADILLITGDWGDGHGGSGEASVLDLLEEAA